MRPWMAWVAGTVIGLYLALTADDPMWALFSMFFAGTNFGALFATYAPKPKDPTNSTQAGWADRKRRDN